MLMKFVDYLRSIDGVSDVREVTVQVGKSTFDGCRYTMTRDGRTSDRITLLGKRSYHFHKNWVYRVPGDDHDWYICTYWDGLKDGQHVEDLPEDQQEMIAKYHPFGPTFTLTPWDSENFVHGKGLLIDHYEPRYRKRVSLVVNGEKAPKWEPPAPDAPEHYTLPESEGPKVEGLDVYSCDTLKRCFAPSTHTQIDALLARDDVSGLILFQNQELTSDPNKHLDRTAVAYGPGCAIKTLDDAQGMRLGEVPSRFKYPVAFCSKN